MLGNEDLEQLYVIEKFPIYCGTTKDSPKNDVLMDMKWGISKGSGMIQLMQLVPLDKLYSVSHNGSIGIVWREHHLAFAKFIYENANVDLGILEIGGGNGILNSLYNSKYRKCRWTIVEPSEVNIVENVSAEYIKCFWENTPKVRRQINDIHFGTIVHSHLMEHQYDVRAFMDMNSEVLEVGERMIFSIPHLEEYLRRGYMNALNFEHTYFIIEDYLNILFDMYGFKLIKKVYFREEHSIFYAVEKCQRKKIEYKDIWNKLYKKNLVIFEKYITGNINLVNSLNKKIDAYEDGKVFLFGAHIFAQYLLAYGLHTDKVECILDNDIHKQGERLYGTNYITYSPDILKKEKKPAVIVIMGAYTDEISFDILNNINANAVIWRE